MSGLSGTYSEVFYSHVAVGTQLNTFTTEDNLQKTYPPVIVPAGFWLQPRDQYKSIHIRAMGRLGSTSTPTFTFSLRALTSTTWSAGGLLLGTSNAITAGSTVTLAPFFVDIDVTLKTLSIGGASTVITYGEIRGATALVDGGHIPVVNAGTFPQITTLDNSSTYYLFLSVACGTSNSLNLIQLEALKVYGEN